MSRRYEVVEEPEALEIAEDEVVYNPNQSVREISSSLRSLEPMIAGPVSLKSVFYDPRWSRQQRQFCFGVIVTLVLICFALVISLFVGLIKVIAFIQLSEQIKNAGLVVIPTLVGRPDLKTLAYCSDKPECATNYTSYIAEMQAAIADYKNKTAEVCASPSTKQLCNDFGTSCSSDGGFGYQNNTPCVLLKLRRVEKWKPMMDSSFINSLQKGKFSKQKLSNQSIPVLCEESHATSGLVVEYHPPEGFSIEFINRGIEPMVMAHFTNIDDFPGLEVKCRVYSPDDFAGVKEVEFAFKQRDLASFLINAMEA